VSLAGSDPSSLPTAADTCVVLGATGVDDRRIAQTRRDALDLTACQFPARRSDISDTPDETAQFVSAATSCEPWLSTQPRRPSDVHQEHGGGSGVLNAQPLRLRVVPFSTIKWSPFRLSRFKGGAQNGPLFDQQMVPFSVDKNSPKTKGSWL